MAEPRQLGPENQKQLIDRLTEESIARGFIEYPKMLHHTDGGNVVVSGKQDEETALATGNYHPTPTLAQAEKAKRDEAERKRLAVAVGKESAKNGKKNGADAPT